MYLVQWLLAVASQLRNGLPEEGRLPGHSQEPAAGPGVLLPHSLLLDEGHPQHQLGQLLHAGQQACLRVCGVVLKGCILEGGEGMMPVCGVQYSGV